MGVLGLWKNNSKWLKTNLKQGKIPEKYLWRNFFFSSIAFSNIFQNYSQYFFLRILIKANILHLNWLWWNFNLVKSAPTLKAQSLVIFQYHPNRYNEKDMAKGFFMNMFFWLAKICYGQKWLEKTFLLPEYLNWSSRAHCYSLHKKYWI